MGTEENSVPNLNREDCKKGDHYNATQSMLESDFAEFRKITEEMKQCAEDFIHNGNGEQLVSAEKDRKVMKALRITGLIVGIALAATLTIHGLRHLSDYWITVAVFVAMAVGVVDFFLNILPNPDLTGDYYLTGCCHSAITVILAPFGMVATTRTYIGFAFLAMVLLYAFGLLFVGLRTWVRLVQRPLALRTEEQ